MVALGLVYNLTCIRDEGCRSTLVSDGVTGMLHELYTQFSTSVSAKTWCVLSICNLALGKVNSSRIVSDNGGVALIDFIQTKIQYRSHHINEDDDDEDNEVFSSAASSSVEGQHHHNASYTVDSMYHIISAAFRKLITPPGNQKVIYIYIYRNIANTHTSTKKEKSLSFFIRWNEWWYTYIYGALDCVSILFVSVVRFYIRVVLK